MRITGWHVDGYGRFHDRGWDALPPGLTVLHGPNEAGKSTLLSFLRSMLFGLRDGRSSSPAIPALAGGRHGGLLRVTDEAGAAWTIERHGRALRVLDDGGTGHDQRALDRLLGGVGRDVFEAVFAFGLRELEALGGLDDEALRDQLFAASLTGGGSSAHDAVATLDARVERLWRPRGDSPLRDLDRRLKELRAERRVALDGQDRHATLRAHEAEADAAILDLDDRTRQARREHERLARLARVWTLVDPLDRRRAELAALAGGPDVSPDEVTAARDADREAAAAAERRAEVRARRRRTGETLDGLAPDPRLLDAADALAALDREVVAQRERLLARSGLRGAAARLADEARAAVDDLGPGWTTDAVTRIDASLPVRREAGRHAAAVAARGQELALAEAASAAGASRSREADAEVARRRTAAEAFAAGARRTSGESDGSPAGLGGAARWSGGEADGEAEGPGGAARWSGVEADGGASGLGGTARHSGGAADDYAPGLDGAVPPTTDELDAATAAVAELRGALQDLAGRRTALDAARDVLFDLQAAAARPGPDPAVVPGPSGVPVLLLIALVGVVAGIGVLALGQPVGGVVLVLVGLATLAAHRSWRAGDAAVEDARRSRAAEAESRAAEHADRLRRAEHDVRVAREAVEALERLIVEVAPTAGLAADVLLADGSTAPVERRAADLQRLRDRRRRLDDLVAALRVAEDEARVAARRAADDAARVERARTAANDADRAWRMWSDHHGLPDHTAADDAPALLTALERAQDALRAAADAVAAADDADAALHAWTGRAVETLLAAGWVADTGAGAVGPLAAIGPARVAQQNPVPSADRAAAHDAVLRAVVETHATAVDAAERAARRAVLLERDAQDAAEEERLTARIGARTAERDALLARHGCDDVASLARARETTGRRVALEEAVRDGEAALRAEAGAGPDADALVDEARTGDVGAWATRRDGLDVELARLDEARTAAIAARTDAVRDREALERSVDLPRIDGEIEEVRADAARLLGELRTVLRAKELVTTTLDAFVRDRQPTVLRDASTWFSRVTAGRYVAVRQTVQERRGRQVAVLQVVSPDGATHDPVTLSRGTREQLYLALRLALVCRTAREATPLPLVMDDVLVNVSPDRARVAAQVIAEVAHEHQVLFFTCHPATRDLLVEAAGAGAVRVEELTRA